MNKLTEDLYILRLELRQKYEAALQVHTDYVRCAAYYLIDFANNVPNISYTREIYFLELVDQYKNNLPELAKNIDEDINSYWRDALSGLEQSHDVLFNEYKQKFGKNKKSQQLIVHGRPGPARIQFINKDISKAKSILPNYNFESPKDIGNWKKLSEICIPVINDAFETHKEIVLMLKDDEQRKLLALEKRVGVLGHILSKAVDLGSKVLLPGAA